MNMSSKDAIEQTIRSFPRWHYQFDLDGRQTPIFDQDHINRHAQRRRYFFEPLVTLCGGTLQGKRVLDLGCNAGYWSLCAVEAGCDFVLGIDGRQMHVEQANFVFRVKNVAPSRYQFRCATVYDALDDEVAGSFDIVLCLGLLYHINKHINLFEKISQVNSDLLLIDTVLSMYSGSALELRRELLDEPRNAVDYELVMYPTRAAVLDMARLFGYETVVLPPAFTDWTGAEDFRTGTRRAFICSKRTSLTALPSEDTR
jgi:SAM-dependent methyltransferase